MTFAVYLEGWQMPIPIWTKSKGFHVIRYPLQQVLAVCLPFLLFHGFQLVLWVESNTHMTLKSVSCLWHVLHLFLLFAHKDQNSNLKSGLFIGIF